MSQEQTFYDKANKLADTIKAKANALRAILSEYQTHETTDYEIERSIRTLRNLSEISSHLNHQTDSVASVLPSNLPLYSLILFAVMPAAIAEEVNIRPNTLLQQHAVVSRLSDALGLKELFPAIHIRDVDHEGFRPYLHKSDAVIFTGNPAHAQNILAEMKEGALLISNGSGHNPLVVTNSADIDKVVEAAIHLKSLNGGQDCAGPDAILVQESVANVFTQKFQAQYAATKTGAFSDPEVRIGPIERATELQKFADVFQKNKDHIISGGTIDFERSIVVPTIVKRPIQESPNFREMFGPVAFIHTYKDDNDLAHYFEDTEGRYQANRMYVSLFGNSDYIEARDDAKNPGKRGNIGIVLHDKTIHEEEIGYRPYGGYSLGASAIWRKTPKGIEKAAMPTLIPEIIDRYLIRKETFPQAAAEQQPKQKEISPIIEGFQTIAKEVFGDNLAFGFFAKDHSQAATITAFICLRTDNEQAAATYQARMKTLLAKFNLANNAHLIIVPEAELATFPSVTISSNPSPKDLEVVATALALTGDKEGFLGNGKQMSTLIKQVQPRIIGWKQQVIGNEPSEQTPNQVMNAWLASHDSKQQQARA